MTKITDVEFKEVDSTPVPKVNLTLKKASEKIKVILDKYKLGIQPYLSYSEFGVSPQVRLVELPKPNTNETNKGTNKKEAGVSKK